MCKRGTGSLDKGILQDDKEIKKVIYDIGGFRKSQKEIGGGNSAAWSFDTIFCDKSSYEWPSCS